MANAEYILEARGLEKRFGSVVAASGIDIGIAPREMVGMIGANGAGKTTFVNIVTGYIQPDAGDIRFEGRSILRQPPRRIARLGIARSFQIPQVFLTATVRHNLYLALGAAEGHLEKFWRPLLRPELEAEADALLERYNLKDYAGQEAALLPQGIRKLLDIAMAVVRRPKVLLLDEPTSGVSVEEKFAIMDTIVEALRADGVTVLFVEHDMEIVERYAGRVLAFYDGAVISDGAPEEVLSDPEVRRLVIGESRTKSGTAGGKGGTSGSGGGQADA